MVATDIDVHAAAPDPDDPVFALHRGGKIDRKSVV